MLSRDDIAQQVAALIAELKAQKWSSLESSRQRIQGLEIQILMNDADLRAQLATVELERDELKKQRNKLSSDLADTKDWKGDWLLSEKLLHEWKQRCARLEAVVTFVHHVAALACMNTLSRNGSCKGTGALCARCEAMRLLARLEGKR